MTFELLLPFATVNNAGMNMSALIFIEVPFFSSFGYIPNGIAGSDSNSMFNILVNCHSFSTEAISFYIPTSNAWVFQFLHILTNTYIFFISLFLSNSYPKGMRWYLDINPLFKIYKEFFLFRNFIAKPNVCLSLCPYHTVWLLQICQKIWIQGTVISSKFVLSFHNYFGYSESHEIS